MNKKPIIVERYGVKVWCNEEMDNLRREECLCVNCTLEDDCSWAVGFYNMGRDANIALAVTRCPEWKGVER